MARRPIPAVCSTGLPALTALALGGSLGCSEVNASTPRPEPVVETEEALGVVPGQAAVERPVPPRAAIEAIPEYAGIMGAMPAVYPGSPFYPLRHRRPYRR
ncbi:MAG: hypothetical protein HY909_12185 [Deltaproteobacteria bacterium]|nr:hypothetical protein [Deltaproteobacteria bacterium]